MTDYGEMPTPPVPGRAPEPPPRKCRNCIFRRDGGENGMCYRQGVNSSFDKPGGFIPRPCFPDNSCFHHQYIEKYRRFTT